MPRHTTPCFLPHKNKPPRPLPPCTGEPRPGPRGQGGAPAPHVCGARPRGRHVQLLRPVQVHQAVPAEEGGGGVSGTFCLF